MADAGPWTPIPLDASEEIWEPRIFQILELVRSSNMDLSLFFTRFMSAKSKRLKAKQHSFFENKGFARVLDAMLPLLNFDKKKKQNSASAILDLKRGLGEGFWKIVQQVLELEMRAYCKSPDSKMSVASVNPEKAMEFDFDKLAQNFRTTCPLLSAIINGVIFSGEIDRGNKRKRGAKRCSGRNRSLVSTIALCVLASGHSRLSNVLQTPLGYYFQASGVPKRVIGFLNRIGVSVAYPSISESMKAMGIANIAAVRNKIRDGVPLGIMWDNNAMFENKADQSVKNARVLTQYTCAAMWFLNLPKPVEPIAVNPGVSEQNEDAGRGFLQGSDIRSDFEADMRSYVGLSNPEEPNVGLEGQYLFKQIPDYTTVNKMWLLSKDSYAEYMPQRVVVHMSDILWKYFPKALSALGKKDGHVRPSFENIYMIKPVKMDVHALDTMELDETSIAGTAAVIDSVMNQLGLSSRELVGRVILNSGDLGTLLKVSLRMAMCGVPS